nr:MAG TPA: hypothetical protein [Caudoviricetes sp.]
MCTSKIIRFNCVFSNGKNKQAETITENENKNDY